ncbi:MAG: DUF1513 domain-containing protein [Rhodospirillales bacterium]|nr:DUF1513 domain-containing protein [Rhodospirillales bacterium]
MLRRHFLKGAAALATMGPALAAGAGRPVLAAESGQGRYLVPGYVPSSAFFHGRPVAEQPAFTKAIPSGYDGLTTMVTRIDERDGAVKRALFPMVGHEITVRPDRRSAFFNSMDDKIMLTFDPDSLELGAVAEAHHRQFTGGGHAIHGPGGELIVSERHNYVRYSGQPEKHYGRIVVRDPESLRVIEVYNSHGIAPHQIAQLAGEQAIAVTHYGSTSWPGSGDYGELPYIVEPCLTVIDLRNGKLLHKEVGQDKRFDLRHLAVHGRDRIFAIQGRLAPMAEVQEVMKDWAEIYEPDVWSASEEVGYLPAPVLRYDLTQPDTRPKPVSTDDPLLMRYGQSIVFDPVNDEAIATFPSRHAVVVFAGADGSVKRVIRTDRLGLHQPRGLAFHPDGRRYAVSGYWRNIQLFERGSHEPDPDGRVHTTFFGHSHLTLT